MWRLFGEGKENFMEGARGSGKSNILTFFINLLLNTGRFKIITNVNAILDHHPNFYFVSWLKEVLIIIMENAKKNALLEMDIRKIEKENDKIRETREKELRKNPEIYLSTLEDVIKLPNEKIMYCAVILDESESIFTSQDSVFKKEINWILSELFAC